MTSASLIAQLVKNPPAMKKILVPFMGRLHPVFLGFPGCSACNESACSVEDLGSISGLGRSPGERKGYQLQYPGLENSKDYTVHGILQARIQDWVAIPFCRRSSQPMD